MGPRLLVAALLLLLPGPLGTVHGAFQYLGNGFCTSAAGARPDTFMCDASGDSAAAVCEVDLGGHSCAAVCEATGGCTGFMVQDNSMYGMGAVCQIVSTLSPPKPPDEWDYGWRDAKWSRQAGAGTEIDAHDQEKRDSCFKRVGSCPGRLPECAVAGVLGTKFAPPAAPCCISARVLGSRSWGVAFLLGVALALACYVGGGVAMGRSSSGAAVGGLRAHVHYTYWESAAGLVADGVLFATRGKGGGDLSHRAVCVGYVQDTSSVDKVLKKQSSRKKLKKEKKEKKGKGSSSKASDTSRRQGHCNPPPPPQPRLRSGWQPTRTGHLAVGARETGVRVTM